MNIAPESLTTTTGMGECHILYHAKSAQKTSESGNIPSSIAVLIPCYDEEKTIGKVISDFKREIPHATIYVYDNNSQDNTAMIARNSGALVKTVSHRGKGNVVRRMFAEVDAEVYVLVDGDDTYESKSVRQMISTLTLGELDMVVGVRRADHTNSFPKFHSSGNVILTGCVRTIFGRTFSDMLSGYRVFSRRFVKSFPSMSTGFEIETEITVHALELRMPAGEVDTPYYGRVDGSKSKLKTYRDGLRILKTIVSLYKSERPLQFFSLISLGLLVLSLALIFPVVVTYIETGLVPRIPTAVLSMGIGLMSILAIMCGLILETVTRGRQEMKRMFYLSVWANPSDLADKKANEDMLN